MDPQARPGRAGLKAGDESVDTPRMTYLKRTVRFAVVSLSLAVAGLGIGAYTGGASGADERPPATASLRAANCTPPPAGVAAGDWCPGGN